MPQEGLKKQKYPLKYIVETQSDTKNITHIPEPLTSQT